MGPGNVSRKMRPVLNTKMAFVGSVLTGIGASVCFVGPLLLLNVGGGGAWIAHPTAHEPVRPLFIALTVAFLGLAFRRLYCYSKIVLWGSDIGYRHARFLAHLSEVWAYHAGKDADSLLPVLP